MCFSSAVSGVQTQNQLFAMGRGLFYCLANQLPGATEHMHDLFCYQEKYNLFPASRHNVP
jgi:hypothetical protein